MSYVSYDGITCFQRVKMSMENRPKRKALMTSKQVSGLVVALALTLAGASSASTAGRDLPLDMSSILETFGDPDLPLLDAVDRALGKV